MHRGRAVLAIDCVLAGLELQRGRPLNSIVRCHVRATFALTDTSSDTFEVRCTWWGREEYLLNGELLDRRWSAALTDERQFHVGGHTVRIVLDARGKDYIGRAFVDDTVRVAELYPSLKARAAKKPFTWRAFAKTTFIWFVIGVVGTYMYLGFTKGW